MTPNAALTAATLGIAALAVAAFAALRSAPARRRVLLAASGGIGVLLSLRDVTARRLSALLFLLSILLVFLVWLLAAPGPNRRTRCRAGIAALVLLFVGWKAAFLQAALYRALHIPERYLVAGAWLGGSYILFRLIHVLIEAGKPGFPELSLGDLALYVLFPATLLAGPIARVGQFWRSDRFERPAFGDAAEGGRRIVVGIFKKFVVADFIAALPIDFAHAGLSPARMWVSLYLFGFQLFFDFAGYCDIAIGAAALVGFSIPENFDSPYLRSNITKFWQSWHATLSGWMRDYVFFPLGKLLRRRMPGLPAALAAFICQVATMVIIGIWHGLFLGYAVWGVWHGVGLFIHRQWSRGRAGRPAAPWAGVRRAGAVFATFQFVMLGWVFFYATSLRESLAVIAKLAGR